EAAPVRLHAVRPRRRARARPERPAPQLRPRDRGTCRDQREAHWYLRPVNIRHAEPADHARVAEVIDDWWGGRHMRDMFPRLFFAHFRETSFVAEEEEGKLAAFLCGFLSQTHADEAYIHFAGC